MTLNHKSNAAFLFGACAVSLAAILGLGLTNQSDPAGLVYVLFGSCLCVWVIGFMFCDYNYVNSASLLIALILIIFLSIRYGIGIGLLSGCLAFGFFTLRQQSPPISDTKVAESSVIRTAATWLLGTVGSWILGEILNHITR